MLFYGHKYIEQFSILIFLSRLPTSPRVAIAKLIDYNVMHVLCYWVVQFSLHSSSLSAVCAAGLLTSCLLAA